MDTTVILPSGYTSGGIAVSSLIKITGTWGTVTSVADGPGANAIYGNTVGATAYYDVDGSEIDVFVTQRSTANGATYNIRVDGTLVPGGPFATANLTDNIQVRTITGLSPGIHTVAVEVVDVTLGGLAFHGFRGRRASGLRVDKYARGGWTSYAWKNGTNFTFLSGTGQTIGGALTGTIGEAGKWSGGSKNPADALIYSLGVNESRATTSLAPDLYQNAVHTFMQDFYDGGANQGDKDVMIVMQHQGQLSTMNASYNYLAYCERMEGFARANGCAFINLNLLGRNSHNWMVAQGFMGNSVSAGTSGSDSVHLSDAGFAWAAGIITPYWTAL